MLYTADQQSSNDILIWTPVVYILPAVSRASKLVHFKSDIGHIILTHDRDHFTSTKNHVLAWSRVVLSVCLAMSGMNDHMLWFVEFLKIKFMENPKDKATAIGQTISKKEMLTYCKISQEKISSSSSGLYI